MLDAGCGLGDGLIALRQAYPLARLEGLEWSRPLRWLCARRCPWARVAQGATCGAPTGAATSSSTCSSARKHGPCLGQRLRRNGPGRLAGESGISRARGAAACPATGAWRQGGVGLLHAREGRMSDTTKVTTVSGITKPSITAE